MRRLACLTLLALGLAAGAEEAMDRSYQHPGVEHHLPVFYERLSARLTFPWSWLSGRFEDFSAWRRETRRRVMDRWLTPPPTAEFAPVVLAEEDRGAYLARKLALNLTGDSRVAALMTIPKSPGPHAAVLLLHDHGARFDIGKEKVIRPVAGERLESATEWVNTCYGGRWLGDELARRGYVCLATDMLNWSDRGGGGYEGQQALAGNLFQLGTSFAGLIAWEDHRAAEFLATRPEVDPNRVAAMGLSVGSYRTWQLAATDERIAAGAAICWMATVQALQVPGQNQTGGQSAFTMIHPGLLAELDYPDLASLACPKPMLFYNGTQDKLFPVPSVESAYAKLRRVWDSQGAGDWLETRLWDVPHVFDAAMQEAAFTWLARWVRPNPQMRTD